MREYIVERKAGVDTSALKLRAASDSDYTLLINEPCIVRDAAQPDVPLIVFAQMTEDTSALFHAMSTIKYQISSRTGGMLTRSRIFGFQPRVALRRDFCCVSSLARESPDAHATICAWGARFSDVIAEHNPALYAKQHETVYGNVREDWIMPKSLFTSGICNKDNPLYYHFDAGNFPGLWSAMIVFQKHLRRGGHLSVPEYDVGFNFNGSKPWVILFDGQGLLHGVTPIEKGNAQAYRYSAVYYSLRGMQHCLSAAEEVARVREKKTAREKKRAGSKVDE